jgi:hypothetical protein
MALALARFLFGLSATCIAVGVLLIGTLLCIRLIGIVVHLFENEHMENLVGGLCVLGIATGSLVAIYAATRGLHQAIGASQWVGNTPNWLVGNDNLSAAAVLGALAGLALLGSIPFLLNRSRQPKDPAAKAAGSATQAAAKAATKTQARAAVAPKSAKAKPAAAPRPKRIGQLGSLALLLLVMSGAVLVFAFSLDPLWEPQDAPPDVMATYLGRSARAQFVYTTALVLLCASGVSALAWFFSRRKD